MIIPVASVMPAMIMLIPPELPFSPAPFASFAQFVAPVFSLRAEVSMVLNGLVEFAFRVNSTLVAPIVGNRARRHEQQGST